MQKQALQNRPFFSWLYGYLLSGSLAIAMGLSMVGAFFSTAQQSDDENRRFSTLPKLPDSLATWETFPQQFDAFFSDHFGFRAKLIRTNTAISTTLLDRLPSDYVIAGKNDWLFYAAENSLALYQRTAPLPPHVIERWQTGLGERANWLASKGIGYAFVIAPDKHTIHTEQMPRYLRVSNVPSQYDQIVDLARIHALPVIDLRPTLLAAKADAPVYYRDDTHWNAWGAYLGYSEIMEQIAKHVVVKPVSMRAGDFEMRAFGSGDLARMALMQRKEMVPTLQPETLPCAAQTIETKTNEAGTPVLIRTRCESSSGKLLLFRDSFSDALLPYFAASFKEVVAVWSKPTSEQIKELVAQERPDFVLEERVERQLRGTPDPRPKS